MKTKVLNYNVIWKIFHIICFITILFVFIFKCFALNHPLDIHVEIPEVKEYLDDLEKNYHFPDDDPKEDEKANDEEKEK
jgi:hypothetical protein